MNKYKCVIIDDEQYAIKKLGEYVKAIPYLMLIKSYTDPLEAVTELSAGEQIDLVLLDIQMPLMTGIDLSHKIRSKVNKLVFTTAHSQYGYDAFEVEADAYLLKPYTLSKFAATMGKIFTYGKIDRGLLKEGEYFFAKNNEDNYKLVKIRYKDIVAVESRQNYVLIHTLKQNVLTHMSLTEINRILDPYPGFTQLQRSFIIGLDHIDYIYGNTIKMINGLEITIGEYYRKNFNAFLTEKIIKAG